jgi:hypothetical protein
MRPHRDLSPTPGNGDHETDDHRAGRRRWNGPGNGRPGPSGRAKATRAAPLVSSRLPGGSGWVLTLGPRWQRDIGYAIGDGVAKERPRS